MRSDKMKK